MKIENSPLEKVPETAKPEYALAGRYIKHFLEARTEGRRAHSWDHTLFVAHQAIQAGKEYAKEEGVDMTTDKEFSLYIASLIHDVIQPDDIRNEELKEKMKTEWGLDEEGEEGLEGVKAFNYVVDSLQKKLANDEEVQLSDVQNKLIYKLTINREQIVKIFQEKERKDLSKWGEMTNEAKALSIADAHGNWNTDYIFKLAGVWPYLDSKKPESERLNEEQLFGVVLKRSKEMTEPTKMKNGVAVPQYYYHFYHDENIVSEMQKVAPGTLKDAYTTVEHLDAFAKEKRLLDLNPKLKEICRRNGIGIFGMVSFFYNDGSKNLRDTSQEIFERYLSVVSARKSVDEIVSEGALSAEDKAVLDMLIKNQNKAIEDIKKYQETFALAKEEFGVGL